MISFRINGNEIPLAENITTLESLVLHANAGETADDQIIVEIRVDGRPFTEAYARQARDIVLDQVGEVEIITESSVGFANRFMEKLPVLFDHMTCGFEAASKLLQDPDSESDGHDMLLRSLDTLMAVKNHIANVRTVTGKSGDGEEMTRLWEDLDKIADDLMACQESMDSRRTAFVLNDRLIPFVQEWKRAAVA